MQVPTKKSFSQRQSSTGGLADLGRFQGAYKSNIDVNANRFMPAQISETHEVKIALRKLRYHGRSVFNQFDRANSEQMKYFDRKNLPRPDSTGTRDVWLQEMKNAVENVVLVCEGTYPPKVAGQRELFRCAFP